MPTQRGIAEVDSGYDGPKDTGDTCRGLLYFGAGKLEGQLSPHLVDRGTGPARGRSLLYLTMTRAQDWA